MSIHLEYGREQYEDATGDLEVRLYPNPVLTEVSEAIADAEFGPEIERFGQQMIAVMNRLNGLGLSAPQVGVLKRVFVMNFENKHCDPLPPAIICNPVLTSEEEGTFALEGCLSLPGVFEQVWRAGETHMRYQTPYGEHREMVLLGVEARAAQHETDHLDGVLFFQRMNHGLRKGVLKAWSKKAPRKMIA